MGFRKKIFRILLYTFGGIILLLLTIVLLLHTSFVQNYLIHYTAEKLSEFLKTKVTIEELDTNWLSKLSLKNAIVYDQENQKMLAVKSISANLFSLKLKERKFKLRNLTLEEPNILLYKNKGKDTFNFAFILDAFKSKGGESKPVKIELKNIELQNAKISLTDSNASELVPIHHYINPRNLSIQNFSTTLSVSIDTSATEIKMKNLSLKETNSGFSLEKLSFSTSIEKNKISLENMELKTPGSHIAGDFSVAFKNFKAITDSIWDEKFDCKFSESKINLQDLQYAVKGLSDFGGVATLNGEIKGSIGKINLKHFKLTYSDSTRIEGNFKLTGLPDVKNTLLEGKIDDAQTNYADLKKILPKTNIPGQIKNLGDITMRGRVTGFLKDFVAEATFGTNAGTIATNLNMKFTDDASRVSYEGSISFNHFQLNQVTGLSQDVIGRIDSCAIKIQGTGLDKKTFHADVTVNLRNVSLQENNIYSLNTKAHVQPDKINGHIVVADPSVNLDADANLDLSGKLPSYSISGLLGKTDLKKFNLISEEMKIDSARFAISTQGNSLDNLTGDAHLKNISLLYNNRNLQMDSLHLVSKKDSLQREISLVSEYFSANVRGQYEITDAIKELTVLFKEYNLSLNPNDSLIKNYYAKKDTTQIKKMNFNYELTLKNSQPLLEVFAPDVKISPGTRFYGNLNTGNAVILNAYVDADSLYLQNVGMKNVALEVNTSKYANQPNILASSSITVNDVILSGTETHLQNFTAETVWDNNILNFNVSTKELQTESKARIYGKIKRTEKTLDILFDKINLFVQNENWSSPSGSKITYHDFKLFVSDFSLQSKEKIISASGVIGKAPTDFLTVSIANLPVSAFSKFLTDTTFRPDGIINGKIIIHRLAQSPRADADITVSYFEVNENKLGQIISQTRWNPGEEKISMLAYITDSTNQKIADITGDYVTKTNAKQMNFSAELNKIPLILFYPFIGEQFSELEGNVSASLKMQGNAQKSSINGSAEFSDAKMRVNYTKTKYSLAGKVNFNDENIGFENLYLTDEYGGIAHITNGIHHDGFENFKFNIVTDLNSFQSLNTTSTDNVLYYGRAIASGKIYVEGTLNNLNISADLTSQKGTSVSIPISPFTEVTSSDFVMFVSHDTTKIFVTQQQESVDLSGIKMNLNLNITPDAEMQIIFDPKVGDIIKGKGQGRVRMEITPEGFFTMFGQVEIVEGDYLFTAQNIVNKKFIIEPGGTITWNGDPYEAKLDMDAVYRVRTTVPFNPGETDDTRYTVLVKMLLTGNLLNPNINLGVSVPDADESSNVFLSRVKADEQFLNQQVFGLLVMNRFLPGADYESSPGSENVAGATASTGISELLSNQLSNLLSQVSDKVDVSLKAGSGEDALRQLEVAVGASLFKDRVRIEREGGFSTEGGDASGLIGNWSIQYRLSKSGQTSLEFYNKENVLSTNKTTTYTQGIALRNKIEFNKLSELKKKKKKEKNQ